jgi:AAA+ ATPase superfamily predicted ATPase
MTKKELLEKLNSSDELVKLAYIPVSEVIKWINELEESSNEMNEELIDQIVDEIANEGFQLIDDYDLSMSYREVELDSVELDRNVIKRAIQRVFN